MFKRKSIIEENYENFLNSNLTSNIRRKNPLSSEDIMSFNDTKKYLEKCVKEIKRTNNFRKILFDYIGFSNGETTNYTVEEVRILEINKGEELFLNEKITTQEEIKAFLKQTSPLYEFPTFIYVDYALFDALNAFNLDLSLFKGEDISNLKEEFLENYSEEDYGFIKNNFAGVGYSYSIYICNKDIVWKNLELIAWYLRRFYESLLNTKFQRKVIGSVSNIIDNLPIVTTTDELLSSVIAYGDKITRLEILNSDIENKKELILISLEKNVNCYNFLPDRYMKDLDICKRAVTKSLSILPSVIENGPIKEAEWNKLINDFLNTKTN